MICFNVCVEKIAVSYIPLKTSWLCTLLGTIILSFVIVR